MPTSRYRIREPTPLDVWRTVRTWDEILALNEEFIRGEIPMTPYHLGPLESDSVPLAGALLALHDRGLLTVDGQSGRLASGYSPRTDRFYEIEQRPYLAFYVRKSDPADRLMQMILDREDLVAFVYDRERKVGLTSARDGTDGVSVRYKQTSFCVTRDRGAKRLADVPKKPWRAFTHLSVNPHGDFHNFPNVRALLDRTYHVAVAGREFGEGGLEERILEMCDSAGVRR